jgi:hypothetical protein
MLLEECHAHKSIIYFPVSINESVAAIETVARAVLKAKVMIMESYRSGNKGFFCALRIRLKTAPFWNSPISVSISLVYTELRTEEPSIVHSVPDGETWFGFALLTAATMTFWYDNAVQFGVNPSKILRNVGGLLPNGVTTPKIVLFM